MAISGLQIQDQAVQLARALDDAFAKGVSDGVLGLGFSEINTVATGCAPDPQPTLMENMISQSDIPKEAQLFTSAFYTSPDSLTDSFYTFGWIDQDLVTASGKEISWAEVDSSRGFWMFDSHSITINGQTVTESGNKAIANTSTPLALVSDEVCDALYAQIDGVVYSEQHEGYLIPTVVEVENLPDVSVAVGDEEFAIRRVDLVFAPVDGKYWYGSVQSRGKNPFDILGGVFLKSVYAVSCIPWAAVA